MKNELELKIKRLTATATLPNKAHATDACFDIYADLQGGEGIVIPPQEMRMIGTGFATEIPSGYWGAIFARSGLASKRGLRPCQGVPVIDEPYRGEWKIPLYNDSASEEQVINHGDKICQFMLLPYFNTKLTEVDTLDSTERGAGGFGSTGV